MQELEAAGVSPADINTVFFSHLHFDHVGWNVTHEPGAAARATFPNARYVAHRADWEVFQQPRGYGALSASLGSWPSAPLQDLGVLELLDGERSADWRSHRHPHAGPHPRLHESSH